MPLFAAAHHNVAELIGIAQSTQTVDGQRLLLAVKHRRSTNLPGRPLHVLLVQRLSDIFAGDVQRVHAIRPQPDAHAVVARAEHLYLADAGHTRQRFTHLGAGVVADLQRRQGRLRRIEAHPHQQVTGALAHLYTILLRFRRQLRHRLCNAVLYINGRHIGVGARGKGQVQAIAAVISAGRLHIEHMINAVELCLQRRGDGLRYILRAGARPAGADVHHGRRDLRVLLHRNELQRDRTAKDHQQSNHHRETRTTDKKRQHPVLLNSTAAQSRRPSDAARHR